MDRPQSLGGKERDGGHHDAAVSAEYAALANEAQATAQDGLFAVDESPSAAAELRRRAAQLALTLEQIEARDYFRAVGRAEAERAVLAVKARSPRSAGARAR